VRNTRRRKQEGPRQVAVVEVVAAAVLVAIVLMAAVAAVVGKANALRLLSLSGVLLLAVLAVHRGDAALLSGIAGILKP
jgi:hypothetical protein